ncbi:MAG: UDP-N-acetylmuramoyl-L-alanyl-D-glutamate--2,6-diaminopimelate ligase [Anaerolineales bacterium]
MKDRIVELRRVLDDMPVPYECDFPLTTQISGVAIDSRAVKSGDLFVALRGGSADGHDFAAGAIARGAVAVAGDRPLPGLGVPYIRFRDSREALSWIAAGFYGRPGRQLTVIGVTGTDGKTTTTNLIHQILLSAGLKAGMISSVNAIIGDRAMDTGFHVTTPDAQDLQRYMAQMVEAGCSHAILETTSHGWAQHRADACEFDIGVVTNITHEHLDEHGSFENYRAAKARLFESLERTHAKEPLRKRLAVLNRDDASFTFLKGHARTELVSYGLDPAADVHAEQVAAGEAGLKFVVVDGPLRIAIDTPLLGQYNVSNCLAAFAVATRGLGIDPEVAARGIRSLDAVSGRMERIRMGQPFEALVDFAHTPNALRVALQAARQLLPSDRPGRVIVVFGSAGLRDREKRRLMAETAAELADLTVLTAEDPRTESLDAILAEMAAGAAARGAREGETFWRIADRGEAIAFALNLAREGDVVMACGKGHEQSMCFGRVEYPWDDRVALRSALAEQLGVVGPAMPYLPTQDKQEAEWLT